LIWPVLLGHRLIDHDDFWSSPVILLCEHSSFADRNSQCYKIVRSDKTPIVIAIVTITSAGWFGFDGKGQVYTHADHRGCDCRRNTEDARNALHLLYYSAAKVTESCVCRVTRICKRCLHGHDVTRTKARIDGTQQTDGANRQCGAD